MTCLGSLDTLKLFEGVRGHFQLSFFFRLLFLLFLMFNSLVGKYSVLHLFWCVAVDFVFFEQLSFFVEHDFPGLLFGQDLCVADDVRGVLDDGTWLLGYLLD